MSATTHLQCLSSNPLTFRTSQEDDNTTCIVRNTRSSEWTPFSHCLIELFLSHILGARNVVGCSFGYLWKKEWDTKKTIHDNTPTIHIRFNSTRSNAVYRNISWSKIICKTTNHTLNSCFRCSVDTVSWKSLHMLMTQIIYDK
jgi:hypothetical protein